MKRNINRKLPLTAIIYIPTFVVAVLLTVMSCSTPDTVGTPEFSHSSQFKAKRRGAITKPLFMQSKRPMVEFPFQEEVIIDSLLRAESKKEVDTVAVVLDAMDTELDFLNFGDIQKLSVMLAPVKTRFTSERNGHAKVDFMVQVPKELISTKWRVIVKPILLANDSLKKLPEVVITGEEFEQKQKLDYENYMKFLNTLVDKKDYDDAFLDKKLISKDIRNRQNYYWNKYNEEWKKQVAFEKWKFERGDQDVYFTAKEMGLSTRKYHENVRKSSDRVAKDFVDGKDTVGLFNKYMAGYEGKKKKNIPSEYQNRGIELKDVPREYRGVFQSGRTMDDIQNFSLTEDDSAKIARHRYFFDEMALNEVTIARKDEIYKELVKFPLGELTGVRVDTLLTDTYEDYTYHYTYEYPLSKGQKDVQISLSGRIEAVDRSFFSTAKADTLKYFISPLSQLADTALASRQEKVYRNVFSLLTVTPKFEVNKAVVNLKLPGNTEEVEKIINTYYSFTRDKGLKMDSVIMTASSSLEGTYDKNLDLSRRRSVSMKDYLSQVMPASANVSQIFSARYKGEDWGTFAELVEKHPDIKNKEEILKLSEDAVFPDQVEHQIRAKYKSDYKIIMDQIYPKLRKIDIVFNMSRTDMNQVDSVYTVIADDYVAAVKLLRDQKYNEALDLLFGYADYNTALCYVALGENEQASDILVTIEPTADSEYLQAIIATQAGQDEKAVQHLLKACELNPEKMLRIPLDNEIMTLFQKYKLQEEVDQRISIYKERTRSEKEAEALKAREEAERQVSKKYNPDDDDKVGRRIQ